MKKYSSGLLKMLLALLLLYAISILRYFVYPDISALQTSQPGKTAFMIFREQEWLASGKKRTLCRKWVPLSQISPFLLRAVVIAEDGKFYHHHGFDFIAIKAALKNDIRERKFKYGASTITQQLAKNIYLKPSKNPVRKIKEAILTWRLERTLSKSRILELYCNVVEWGEGIFGVEAAARHYYGKSAAELTAQESACLAVSLLNPVRFPPNSNNSLIARRSAVIVRVLTSSRNHAGTLSSGQQKQSALDDEPSDMDGIAQQLDSLLNY